MESKLLFEKSFNKCPPCRNETALNSSFDFSSKSNHVVVPVQKLRICWLVTFVQKYKFLFAYKVASISVCDTSSRFSEVWHFSLNNSPCQKIKTNFRNSGKICRSRINVVVFTANRKFKFLQDDERDYKAPAKRSQHANATYPNIVGRNMLCAFGHHVATCWVLLAQIWPFSNLSQQHPTCHNTSQHGGQTHTTCCAQQCWDMLRWHVAIV